MPPRLPRPGPLPPLDLDLKHFLLRSEALHLYRAFLRVAARAPNGGGSSGGGTGTASPRAELAATIRAEFERAKGKGGGGGKNAATASAQAIKHAIADGKLQLKRLEEMLGMQR